MDSVQPSSSDALLLPEIVALVFRAGVDYTKNSFDSRLDRLRPDSRHDLCRWIRVHKVWAKEGSRLLWSESPESRTWSRLLPDQIQDRADEVRTLVWRKDGWRPENLPCFSRLQFPKLRTLDLQYLAEQTDMYRFMGPQIEAIRIEPDVRYAEELLSELVKQIRVSQAQPLLLGRMPDLKDRNAAPIFRPSTTLEGTTPRASGVVDSHRSRCPRMS